MIETPKDIQDILNTAGFKYNVNPAVLKAFAYTESRFRSEAVSESNVHGMFQITQNTWKSITSEPYSIDNKAQANIAGQLLSKLSKKYNGNMELIAIGYNAGEGIADKLIGKDINFTNVEKAIVSHDWRRDHIKNVDAKVKETWDYIGKIKSALAGELSDQPYEFKSTPGTSVSHVVAKINPGSYAITPDLSVNTDQLFLVAANDSKNFKDAVDQLYTVCVKNTSRNGLKNRTNSLFGKRA